MLPNGFYLSSMWEWMAWNTFLALIPFVLSYYLFRKKSRINLVWVLGFIIFVVFMPNAPYVLTDVMHLFFNNDTRMVDPAVAVLVFGVFIVFGVYLFVKSYQKFETFAVLRTKQARFVIRFISFVILSIGVYLGRFPRLNSWDVVRPERLLEGSLELLSLHALGYVTLFTVLLWLVYFLYERTKPH